MKRNAWSSAAAIAGAVIGAGFASGREIVVFFSRYGLHGWWLAGLSVAVMTGLCRLCLTEARRSGSLCWCALFEDKPRWSKHLAQMCVTALLAVMGGSMLSASGHMIALMWPNEWAYSLGAAGTMAAAWFLGRGSMKPMSMLSGVLTGCLLGVMGLALLMEPSSAVQMAPQAPGIHAAVRVLAYAGMNMTLAMGVVCCCAQSASGFTPLLFGALMALLTGAAHALYSRHPEWMQEAFPLVRLLSGMGRKGFWLSAVLLYLSILTSLTAVLCALRCAFEQYGSSKWTAIGSLALPLLLSLIGFEGIVDHVYAPVGLVCLALVFGPLILYRRQT